MSTIEMSAIVAAVVKALEAKNAVAAPVVARKVPKGTGRKAKASKATKVAKPKAAAPAKSKTYDGPFAVKVHFTRTGGLVHHGGCNVLYRPEGTEAEQIHWLAHNGLDSALYVGLVKSEEHKSLWLTYAESKAAR